MDTTTTIAAKPYNRCIKCPHRKEHRCDGPRTSAMSFARWCEFMKLLKEEDGLTNAAIAKACDVSVKTIERIFSGKYDSDILRDNARRFEDVIFGTSNQYPCYLAFEEEVPKNTTQLNEALRDLERALADNRDYRAALDAIHVSYGAEMQNIRDSYKYELQTQREEHRKQEAFLLSQIESLQRDKANLWEETIRKSRMIDKFLEQKEISFSPKI